MANLHQAVARLFDIFSQEMARLLGAIESEVATVTWNSVGAGPLAELQWCRATGSGDHSIFFGGDSTTWAALGAGEETGNLGGTMPSWIERPFRFALETQLGPAVIESTSPAGEDPPEGWLRVAFDIERNGQSYSLVCVLSPDLETALQELELAQEDPASTETKMNPTPNPIGILMHVEVPVSVSFGRTRIPMRELLSLNSGSIVELDQALGDRVELRVNDHVIALGEVVAVEGNYGVRIVELVSGQRPLVANESTR